MNDHQAMVLAFYEKFGIKHPTRPSLSSFDRLTRQLALIDEEAQELSEAVYAEDLAGIAQELSDLLYVTYGAAIDVGIDIAPFFAEVHAANMRKTGGAVSSAGKILKPAGWQKPDIAGILDRALKPA